MNDAGQLAGNALRFNGSTGMGYGAFWYDAHTGQYRFPGLTDAAHTGPNGVRAGSSEALLSDGRLVGTSTRYVGVISGSDFSEASETPWLFNPATGETRSLAPTGAVFERSNGYRNASIRSVTPNGLAIMNVSRFDSAGGLGHSAMLVDLRADTTTEVGLFDAEHLRSDGQRSVEAQRVNAAGIVVGEQDRLGNNASGQSAFLFDSQTGVTRKLGLVDATHTGVNNVQTHSVNRLSESGFVTGESSRYLPQSRTPFGNDAWVYNPIAQQTIVLGLHDAVHQRGDGYVSNSLDFPGGLNEAGQVIGYAARFKNGVRAGNSGWFYDSATDATTPLVFSVSTDGKADIDSMALLSNGWVSGRFREYVGTIDNGWKTFLWNASDGLVDMNALIVNGVDPAVWKSLNPVEYRDKSGFLHGYGELAGGGTAPYVLAPVVPEPMAAAFIAALPVVLRRRR